MTAVAPAVKVLAALRSGAALVARPRGTVHLHFGPTTRSGRAVPTGVRPFCGVRSRRLRVVADGSTLHVPTALGGRRFCRACTTRLPAYSPGAGSLVSRDDWLTAFGHLTVADLRTAASWCRTVEETHQVGRLALMLFGPDPIRPTTDEQRELAQLHDDVISRRKRLTAAAMTDDERAAAVAKRDALTAEQARIQASRRKAAAVDRAIERRQQGQYLTRHERELLASP